jgi:hypothetical protein
MKDLKGMTVTEACEAIGYNPADGFYSKPEKEQWSMIRAKNLEYARRDAATALGTFVENELFATLPEDVQEAIRLIGVKRTGGGGGGARKNVFMDTLRDALVNVGDQVDELELFKSLKMGRGEIRAKIRENLKNAEPSARFWVELDEDAEAWVLIGTGKKQPKGWKGAAIDE